MKENLEKEYFKFSLENKILIIKVSKYNIYICFFFFKKNKNKNKNIIIYIGNILNNIYMHIIKLNPFFNFYFYFFIFF